MSNDRTVYRLAKDRQAAMGDADATAAVIVRERLRKACNDALDLLDELCVADEELNQDAGVGRVIETLKEALSRDKRHRAAS